MVTDSAQSPVPSPIYHLLFNTPSLLFTVPVHQLHPFLTFLHLPLLLCQIFHLRWTFTPLPSFFPADLASPHILAPMISKPSHPQTSPSKTSTTAIKMASDIQITNPSPSTTRRSMTPSRPRSIPTLSWLRTSTRSISPLTPWTMVFLGTIVSRA